MNGLKPEDFTNAITVDADETITPAEVVAPETVTPPPTEVVTPPAEVVTPTDATKEKTFFEKLQESKVEAPLEIVQPDVKVKELEAALEKANSKIKSYEESPIGKLAEMVNGEYDLTKVDIKKIAKDMAGEDYSKYDIKDLIKIEIKKEYPNISDEKLEEGVEARFMKLDDWEIDGVKEKIAEKLSASQTPSEIFKQLQKVQQDQIDTSKVNPQEYMNDVVSKGLKEISDKFKSYGEQIVGQEFNGYKATKEDADAINSLFENDSKNYDVDKGYLNNFKIVTYDKYAAAREQAGYERGLKEATNSNPNMTDGQSVIVSREDKKGLAGANADNFREATTVE